MTLAGVGVASAAVVSLCNFIWTKLCVVLTDFERCRTWSSYRKNNALKLVFFKAGQDSTAVGLT